MAKRKTSPMCRRLTEVALQKDILKRMYEESVRTNQETTAFLCGSDSGVVPIMGRQEATKEGQWPFPQEWTVRYWGADPCGLVNLPSQGRVHTHPGKISHAKYLSTADLTGMNKGESVCILYREGKELRIKCVDQRYKNAPIFHMDTASPEVEQAKLFKEGYSKPCNVRVTKGLKRSLRTRLPWRKF